MPAVRNKNKKIPTVVELWGCHTQSPWHLPPNVSNKLDRRHVRIKIGVVHHVCPCHGARKVHKARQAAFDACHVGCQGCVHHQVALGGPPARVADQTRGATNLQPPKPLNPHRTHGDVTPFGRSHSSHHTAPAHQHKHTGHERTNTSGRKPLACRARSADI